MALQKTTLTRQGFEATDAYHRVERILINPKDVMQFFVVSYKSKDVDVSFNENAMSCAYNMNGENPIKQSYDYVKTLSEFSDAQDC